MNTPPHAPPHAPTNEHTNPPATVYEPPAMTVLGTLAELTQGANPGPNSDLTFAGSGVH